MIGMPYTINSNFLENTIYLFHSFNVSALDCQCWPLQLLHEINAHGRVVGEQFLRNSYIYT